MLTSDRSKRLLLKPNLGFRKVGTIGEFWEQGKSKTKMWKDIQAREKRIGEGLEDPDVQKLVTHVADMSRGIHQNECRDVTRGKIKGLR